MDKARVISAEFLQDGSGKKFVVIMGKSSMERPESDLYAQGSVYIDADTGNAWFWDEDSGWPERS